MLNRRSLLQASSFGFGMLALKGLMAEEAMKSNKRVIFYVYEWWYDSY